MSIDSPILQVIVGLVFVYVLLSILVSQINNVIASFLKLRANHLRDGINDLIQDPILRARVLSHPLINLVRDEVSLPSQRLTEDQAARIATGPVNPVNYIEPATFVNVLMNVIRVSQDKDLFAALLNIVDGMPSGPDRRRLRLAITQVTETGSGISELRETIASVQDPVYRAALIEAMAQIEAVIGRVGLERDSVISLIAGLRSIKNPYFRKVMETILSTSRTLDEAERQLTNWFNDGMARVSDAFSRYMGLLSLGVGLLLALILNADSLQIARALWSDPALRFTVATSAQNLTQQPIVVESPLRLAPSTPQQTPETGELISEIANNLTAAQSTVDLLVGLNLPLGWQFQPLHEVDASDPANASLFSNSNNLWNLIPFLSPNWFSLLLSKFIGLAITMVAIAQGAPFWFNVLNRIARGGGISLGR